MTLKCTMILGDCLEVMPTLPRASVQMCFADLPYGVTQNNWDVPVNIDRFWTMSLQLLDQRKTTLMTAIQPFASRLVVSNPALFRYDLIWCKKSITGFLQARLRPLRNHESVLVFYSKNPVYNPQFTFGHKPWQRGGRSLISGSCYGHKETHKDPEKNDGRRYPVSVLSELPNHPRGLGKGKRWHPTQKPVALLDWLIRTYSSPGNSVLDPVSGSGTTALAALAIGRHVTCIEKDQTYFELSAERVRKHVKDNAIDADIEVRS